MKEIDDWVKESERILAEVDAMIADAGLTEEDLSPYPKPEPKQKKGKSNMRGKKISEEALAVLSECTQEGQTVRINSGQLARPLYDEVNSVLVAIGGKWNRSKKGHVFTEPANEISDMLEGCIATGLAVPLRPNGYFSTPADVASRMLELSAVDSDMLVLEPSAGDGRLCEYILKRCPCCHIDAVENDPKLVRILGEKSKGNTRWAVFQHDFLTWANPRGYERVIMNPPFIRLSEISHIKHAYSLLRPGGRLVSVASSGITFRRDPKAKLFRKVIADYGFIEKLPEGSFKDSGTMVNCVLVVLSKPSNANDHAYSDGDLRDIGLIGD